MAVKPTTVYDKKGKAYKVLHSIDVKEWLAAGYTLEKPKPKNLSNNKNKDKDKNPNDVVANNTVNNDKDNTQSDKDNTQSDKDK